MVGREGFAAWETLGRCRFAPHRRLRLSRLTLDGGERAARRLIRRQVPPRPGVYGMIGRDGELLYLGKSRRGTGAGRSITISASATLGKPSVS